MNSLTVPHQSAGTRDTSAPAVLADTIVAAIKSTASTINATIGCDCYVGVTVPFKVAH